MCCTMRLIFLLLPLAVAGDKFHEKLYGSVGSGNYTYYTLQQEGSVTIILHTIEGDADCYVSDKTSHPTFDLENHDFQSVTCGLDIVEIPKGLNRPLAIAVYGHPFYQDGPSSYALEVIIDDAESIEPETHSYDESFYAAPRTKSPHVPSTKSVKDNKSDNIDSDEQSVIWTVLVGILKILLEVITS